ncbi:uncharacterized protein F5891DRAFT_745001 [Suillus fuscotomentosus]|uniref:Uncharacterized protein n=1 Tax=Suillus fuscotomentosus TaxID=1912939 RepID=A0AAD4EE77_9AGAM|nr:uncharacterized protein F5891DRAFT_745001 [Suillus fuscotomentosus]KAG1904490.1 hypothetical protein F5891DRAFT_745001 [Suillus fuscotomentosus]
MVVKSIVPRNAFHLQFPASRESDFYFIFLSLLPSLGCAVAIPNNSTNAPLCTGAALPIAAPEVIFRCNIKSSHLIPRADV